MITAAGALAMLLLAILAWLIRKASDYRIGPAAAVLETHDIVCVTAGKGGTWAVRPRDGSDEQPIPDANPEPSVSTWGHSVATHREVDRDAA